MSSDDLAVAHRLYKAFQSRRRMAGSLPVPAPRVTAASCRTRCRDHFGGTYHGPAGDAAPMLERRCSRATDVCRASPDGKVTEQITDTGQWRDALGLLSPGAHHDRPSTGGRLATRARVLDCTLEYRLGGTAAAPPDRSRDACRRRRYARAPPSPADPQGDRRGRRAPPRTARRSPETPDRTSAPVSPASRTPMPARDREGVVAEAADVARPGRVRGRGRVDRAGQEEHAARAADDPLERSARQVGEPAADRQPAGAAAGQQRPRCLLGPGQRARLAGG